MYVSLISKNGIFIAYLVGQKLKNNNILTQNIDGSRTDFK